jgi:integrase
VRWNLIRSNPAKGVTLPTRERKPAEAWSASERAAFLAAAADDPLLPLWAFLLDSGCRLGEARALAWTDVELSTRYVTIRRTMTRGAHTRWAIGEDTKTAASRRTIQLAPETAALLERQHRRCAELRLAAGPLWHDLGLVFPHVDGTPLPPDPTTAALRRACERAGVPVLTSHGLRKTMTTLWLEAGVSPAVVAARLGHSNVQMTLSVYTKVSRSWGEQGVDRVEEYLRREVSPRHPESSYRP